MIYYFEKNIKFCFWFYGSKEIIVFLLEVERDISRRNWFWNRFINIVMLSFFNELQDLFNLRPIQCTC